MPKRQIRLGFTIVELMVVIVVIGILASLVFVTYTGVQSKVIDSALLSDIDRINIAELKYIESHGNSGKEYYSGNGTDADLNFTPSSGNVIDVAKNTTDYCIRGYNEKAEKNSILNAYTKGSTPTACSVIPPSLSAGATIDAP